MCGRNRYRFVIKVWLLSAQTAVILLPYRNTDTEGLQMDHYLIGMGLLGSLVGFLVGYAKGHEHGKIAGRIALRKTLRQLEQVGR
jgi:predicted CDP-diglyceride synthetase/phosphatidate cytidylyltransferase